MSDSPDGVCLHMYAKIYNQYKNAGYFTTKLVPRPPTQTSSCSRGEKSFLQGCWDISLRPRWRVCYNITSVSMNTKPYDVVYTEEVGREVL